MKTETFYPAYFCEQVRSSAKTLRMVAAADFWSEPIESLAAVMNGCGPDSWTDSMRCLASWVYRNFPEAIAIHDFDFEHADGLESSLKIVNDRFHSNNKKKLNYLYPLSKPWLYPVRSWAWSKIQLAFVALKNGSLEAWVSAKQRLNPDPICTDPLLSE